MAHPICGKCHSAGVYLDYELGQRVLVCPICGNRYPGGREGFHMSDKVNLKDLQTAADREKKMENKETERPIFRVCSTCNTKKTVTPRHNICGSCLAAKGAMKRGQALRNALPTAKAINTKDDKGRIEKSSPRANMAVNIDFGKHQMIFKQLLDLSEQEIRPLDLQIVYLLKHHFSTIKPM